MLYSLAKASTCYEQAAPSCTWKWRSSNGHVRSVDIRSSSEKKKKISNWK